MYNPNIYIYIIIHAILLLKSVGRDTRAIRLTLWQEPPAANERETVTISASTRQMHVRAPCRVIVIFAILFAMGRFVTCPPRQPTPLPGFCSGGAGSRGYLVCRGRARAARLDCVNPWWTSLPRAVSARGCSARWVRG
jgi:hypothetical protein